MISEKLKQKFLNELRDQPYVKIAAQRAGIAKATIYRWKQDDAVFAKEMEEALGEGRDSVSDDAVGQLIAAIRKGERLQYKCGWKRTASISINPEHRFRLRDRSASYRRCRLRSWIRKIQTEIGILLAQNL